MKKLLTSFLLLSIFAFTAAAQGNFTITGSVTDSLGGPVANQQVCIYTDSTQTSFVYYNCVNTTSQGNYSVVIPGGSVLGTPNIVFYVYTYSCNTILQQQTQNNQGTISSATVSFVLCGSSSICTTTLYGSPDSTSNPSTYFFSGFSTQNGNTLNTATYAWSFGDSSAVSSLAAPQHTYTASGNYNVCLTTTTTSGCTSSSCITITVTGGNTCNAQFGYQAGLAGSSTSFNALFGANYTYFWNFGDGTFGAGQSPTHTFANAGIYSVCLTVVDSMAGCSDVQCFNLNIVSGPTYSVIGRVTLPGLGFLTAADYGTVYLVRHDSLLLSAIDTTSIDSAGYYFFNNVSPGTYLVKAALDTTSAYYSYFMPTYHTSSLFWTTATSIFIFNTNVSNANIVMVPGANPGGPGFIGGSVLQGANRLASPGDPIVGISILLLDISNNPIGSTFTDVNGNYSFPSVAYGTYLVYTEIAGKTTIPSIVTISAANPTITNVNIEVNSGTILSVKNLVKEEVAIGIYPNPATDYLTLAFDVKVASTVVLEIKNNLGQVVKSTDYKLNTGMQTITESILFLPQGVYSITVINNEMRSTTKFVKAGY